VSSSLGAGALVLYKSQPALIAAMGEKIEIRTATGKDRKVRPKDVQLLHPGPLQSLASLQDPKANLDETWELLQGEKPGFEELAELVYGEFSPSAAWACWQLLQDGLYFRGDMDAIAVTTAAEFAEERERRESQAREAQEWDDFISRVESATLQDGDRKRLAEVERVALGASEHSRILANFKTEATPEAAHRFLLRCGYWAAEENPWPHRAGVTLLPPEIGVPALPDEERLDLTHLAAWAIDDVGNQDPDDAISLDGDYLWVHVADVAALVRPDGHLDREARERSANLYLPEQTVPMLPESVTRQLGLGLLEESPALSIGMRLVAGEPADIHVERTRVKVRRSSYDEVNDRIGESPFSEMATITDVYRQRRLARNAARLDLPEASVRVVDGEIRIRPLPKMASRDMVTDAMLMAGEAVAMFAEQHDLAIPFAMQPEPEEIRHPATPSEMYAYRRLFKPSNTVLHPEPHFGLGLARYARATSPLRRYADLLVHQQLRSFIGGGAPMSRELMAERIAGIDVTNARIRRAERQSNLHWKLVYLQRHPEWQGEAIVASLEERKAVLLIPELAMEVKVRLHEKFALDQGVRIGVREVDPVSQDAWFRVL